MIEIQLDEKKIHEKMKVLFGRRMSQNLFANKYISIFKGKGIEFESFRAYSISDDADMIDWKASKRANKLTVREYTTEKDIDVFFLIDIGSSMYYSSSKKLKIESAIETMLILTYIAMEVGSKVGFLTFSDEVKVMLPMGTGPVHEQKMLKLLKDPKNYPGGKADLAKAFLMAQTFLRKNTVVFIVSDFLNCDSKWKHILSVMDFKYDVVGVMMRDKRDMEIPEKGFLRVIDPYTNEEMIINTDHAAREYNYVMKKDEDELANHFLTHSADFISLRAGEDSFNQLMKFMQRRALISST